MIHKKDGVSIGKIALASLALLAFTGLSATSARATGFDLGAFATYGLLVNNGASGGDINTAPVNANIGIGNVTGHVNLHHEVVNGKVDCSGSCATAVSGGAITGTQPVSQGGAPSPASVNSNVAAVGTAISTALGLSSTYGAEHASGTAVTIHNTTQTINASSGFLDGSGTHLFTASSFSIGNGHTVTIHGAATDFVVIDITGHSNNKLDGALTLTGGISSDHVLVNFMGSGGNVQGAANGATLNGTFLIPNLGVQLNSLIINGHVFGGAAGKNFQFVSNAFIQQPSTSVPEPASLLLLGIGLFGVATFYRRKFNNI
jgi:hypothetical protein